LTFVIFIARSLYNARGGEAMSQLTVEQIAESIRALTPEEQARLQQLLQQPPPAVTTPPNGESSPQPTSDPLPAIETKRVPPIRQNPKDAREEMAWVEEHRDEYAGQWVALDGKRLLKAGQSAKEVHQVAKALGVPDALIVKVIPRDRLLYADILTISEGTPQS
jgi:hypothetical protein